MFEIQWDVPQQLTNLKFISDSQKSPTFGLIK